MVSAAILVPTSSVAQDGPPPLGPNLRVNSAGDGFYQDAAQIAFGPEGNIYVAWEDWRHAEGSVYFTRSTDGGATFAPEYRVDPSDSVSSEGAVLVRFPCLAVDGTGLVYVAWISWDEGGIGRVFCSRSADEGMTFEEPVIVSDSTVNDRAWPSAAGDPHGGVYIVWCDFRNSEEIVDLYTSRSDDGTSFSPNVKANLAPVGPTCTPPLPDIAAGDLPGYVHIVWRQTYWEDRWIYACRSADGGASFEPAVEVSHEPWFYGG
jgi:hypothetical protein